jgi:hypothetical protein
MRGRELGRKRERDAGKTYESSFLSPRQQL